MAIKTTHIEGLGAVRLSKRRGAKHLKIRLSNQGEVTVSMPMWLPFSAGVKFAESHHQWILKHRKEPEVLRPNVQIGKNFVLKFAASTSQKATFRVVNNTIIVSVPSGEKIEDKQAQAAAKRGARKALQTESPILHARLEEISRLSDLSYKSVNYKFMKSKWGSCRSDGHITLNYRLLDLDNELIDYVLVHELAHTKHLNHSKQFWELVESIDPDFKSKRKTLKSIKLAW